MFVFRPPKWYNNYKREGQPPPDAQSYHNLLRNYAMITTKDCSYYTLCATARPKRGKRLWMRNHGIMFT